MNVSPSQALLIIINHYQQYPSTIPEVEKKLKVLMNPPDPKAEHENLFSYFKSHENDILKGYEVLSTPTVIDEDPTRRYFETHLAFESLRLGLCDISLNTLTTYEKELSQLLLGYDPVLFANRKRVLDGDINEQDNNLCKEYADYLNRIGDPEGLGREGRGSLFTDEEGFSEEDRRKLRLIIKCSFWAVSSAQSLLRDHLPLDIYGKGIFSYKHRGKHLKENSQTTRSQHFGLMKGHMPLPQDDLASFTTPMAYLKSSEQADYVKKAMWNKLSFSRLMHPFSNSISGTALCQLRALAYFHNRADYFFSDSKRFFKDYFRMYVSAILCFSGGHSYFELIYPLQLPEVIDAFSKNGIEDLQLNDATISNIFLSGSPHALYNAINKAIGYNELYLKKQKVLHSINDTISLHPISNAVNQEITLLKEKQKYYDSNKKIMNILLADQLNPVFKVDLTTIKIYLGTHSIKEALVELDGLVLTLKKTHPLIERDSFFKRLILLKHHLNSLIVIQNKLDTLKIPTVVDIRESLGVDYSTGRLEERLPVQLETIAIMKTTIPEISEAVVFGPFLPTCDESFSYPMDAVFQGSEPIMTLEKSKLAESKDVEADESVMKHFKFWCDGLSPLKVPTMVEIEDLKKNDLFVVCPIDDIQGVQIEKNASREKRKRGLSVFNV